MSGNSGTKRVGNEQAVAQAEAARASAGGNLWDKVRGLYPPRVQEMVDAAAECGGVSLPFLELLELAEHERILYEIQALKAKSEHGHRVATAVMQAYHLRQQSRKHLRVLRLAMSPVSSPNAQHHPIPESVARALTALDAHNDDDGDTGSELLS